MKNSQKCTKCQSVNIARIEGRAGAYGVGNNIQMRLTNFSAVKVTRYLCIDCGFSEEWVEANELEKFKRKYNQSK